MLGTVAANRLDGDPVWILLVGPPGGGKSELLTPSPGSRTFTPPPRSPRRRSSPAHRSASTASDAKGGLLRTIGDFGIIALQGLRLRPLDEPGRPRAVLAALREVYDGAWTRHVGTDGGRTLHWAGKVGLVGGCTPTIDRHHAVMGAMGERFALFRLPRVDEDEQARHRVRLRAATQKQRRALWVELPEVLADAIEATLPPREDRDPDARLFPEREPIVSGPRSLAPAKRRGSRSSPLTI